MRLVLGQVRKPIRELRKSLRDLPENPPRSAVHNLRTRSRRLEAISTALLLREKESSRGLLKSMKPLRKAAGDVRDMDVLEAKVRSLIRRGPDPSLERLLAHIQVTRAERARVLVQNFSAEKKTVRRCLERFSKYIEDEFSQARPDARQAHALFDELCHWPRLSAANLHRFRIRVKELRYMLQFMEGANEALLKALEEAKARIGVWHDWEQLRLVSNEVLDAKRDGAAIATIAEIEGGKLSRAMRSAQSLRRRYLQSHSLFDIAEP